MQGQLNPACSDQDLRSAKKFHQPEPRLTRLWIHRAKLKEIAALARLKTLASVDHIQKLFRERFDYGAAARPSVSAVRSYCRQA